MPSLLALILVMNWQIDKFVTVWCADADLTLDAVPPPNELVATLRSRQTAFVSDETVKSTDASAAIRKAVQAQSIVEREDAIQFNAAMKCFLVKGSGGVVRVVRFTPKPLFRPIRPRFLGPGRVLGQTKNNNTR